MCGFAGRFWFHETDAVAARDLGARMAQRMSYRGPDAQDVWEDGQQGIVLAHRRLAIIDLDPRSTQPMQNEDGSLRIVYNGEIYNYRDLRAQLESTAPQNW